MQTGFLYPDKLERLAPFTQEILENWRRAAASPEGLLRVVTYAGARERSWASLASWRHTASAWCTQHLVSRGDPLASRAVLLAEQQAMIEDPEHLSSQNWFRPENRLPQRVFGSIIEHLGADRACANPLTVFEVPLIGTEVRGPAVISEVSATSQRQLRDLAVSLRGHPFVLAEGLDDSDFALNRVNCLYQHAGLFRHRRGWLAHHDGVLVAALVAYRGPLGLNYSFIENRADLLVASTCPAELVVAVTGQLVAAASETYRDFRPGYVPLFVGERRAPLLAAAGLDAIRSYCQTIYLRPSYGRYLDHLESTFARVAQRAERQQRASAPLSTPRSLENSALENT